MTALLFARGGCVVERALGALGDVAVVEQVAPGRTCMAITFSADDATRLADLADTLSDDAMTLGRFDRGRSFHAIARRIRNER